MEIQTVCGLHTLSLSLSLSIASFTSGHAPPYPKTSLVDDVNASLCGGHTAG